MATAIDKYVALRASLLALHGEVGVSPSTGAHLPRLTYADKYMLGGIFLGAVTEAVDKNLNGPHQHLAFSFSKTDGSELTGQASLLQTMYAGHGWDAAGEGGKGYSRPLIEWVSGDPTPDVRRRLVHKAAGELAMNWYVLPSTDEQQAAIGRIMSLWDPFWAAVRAPAASSDIYLTLDETVNLFGILYHLVVDLPAATLHWEIGTAANVWQDVKDEGKKAIKEAAEGVGEAAAWTANVAGESLGKGFAAFLGGVGVWGVALVIGVIYMRSAGIL